MGSAVETKRTEFEFDVQRVRRDFPILDKPLAKGIPLVFLDSAASAQKPQVVIDKEREVYENYYANAYRGVYRFGAKIDEELEAARSKIQHFLGAESADEVIFTSGTTMSVNVVASGWGRKYLKPGDEVLLNIMEHHGNFVPWQQIALQTGATLRFLPLTPDGQLDLAQLDQYLTKRTRILAVAAMSNVLGTINPVDVLVRRAHDVGAIVFVDGAQSVPHLATSVAASGIDFLGFSGHKMYGPNGVGILYGRRELLERLDPFILGGHMISRVECQSTAWAELPARFEGGTLPIAPAIALGTAIDYVSAMDAAAIHAHEQALVSRAFERLAEIPHMRIHGPAPELRGAIVSFTIDKAHPEDLAQLLDRRGVFVRHGHHCTMPLHDWLGVPATVRASFGIYTTQAEIDYLVESLHFALHKLRLE